jgi:hypothetical protein
MTRSKAPWPISSSAVVIRRIQPITEARAAVSTGAGRAENQSAGDRPAPSKQRKARGTP